MAPTNDNRSNEARLLFLSMAILLVSGLVLIVGLSRLADYLGPQLGDIVSFPGSNVPSISTASITVRSARLGGTCVLDVPVMQKSGGSLVIEAAQSRPEPAFQVHWAGVRTSKGKGNCGASADILLDKAQIGVLISAAGGTGAKAAQEQTRPLSLVLVN